MLPSVLLAVAFAGSVEMTFPLTGQPYRWTPIVGGRVVVPVQYAIEVYGNPAHLRNYPWGGGPPLVPSRGKPPLLNPFLLPETPKQPAPVPPPDPTAERIKAIENVILELKARGGSAAVIEQLQHDLDELTAKGKKPK
jgi:hypothetical protein